MPTELALPALRVLSQHRVPNIRRELLLALRPEVPPRTLLNAYVLPSLTELGLFDGTLRSGRVTRYGEEIARAPEADAHALLAQRLIEIDSASIGLIQWLSQQSRKDLSRRVALRRFAEDKVGQLHPAMPALLDRLGKWGAYLVAFGVVRELSDDKGQVWSVSRRQVAALSAGKKTHLPPKKIRGEALLEAYAEASRQLGTRLYIPVSLLRDELGSVLRGSNHVLTDSQLDEILKEAPDILNDHVVSFSPFSGPARGGLALTSMYAGFVSVRPAANTRKAAR
jgi:hypothetical protein